MNTKTDDTQKPAADAAPLDTPPKPFIAEIGSYADKPKSDPVGNVDAYRARRRSVDVDVTQAGATMPPSLPKFGQIQQRPMTVFELEHAWPSLFNEQANGNKLIDDLRGMQHAPEALQLYLFAVQKRVIAAAGDERPRYLVVARLAAEQSTESSKPVVQYMITTEPFESLVMTASPVRAIGVYRLRSDEDVVVKYKLFEETEQAVEQPAGPTEEASEGTVADTGTMFERWIAWPRFLELFAAYFTNDDVYQTLFEKLNGAMHSTKVETPVAMLMRNRLKPQPSCFLKLAESGDRNHPLVVIAMDMVESPIGAQITSSIVIPLEDASTATVKSVVLPRPWLTVGELANRWPSIFHEDDLGSAVIQRLGDLEKNQGEAITLRFVPTDNAHVATLQVFKTADLPSFFNVHEPFVTKNGQPVEPVDLIQIHTTIVEGVEQAVKLEVSDAFMASKHAPKGTAEEVASRFSARGTLPSQLTPSDMRSFDPVSFQLFVDQVRQAAISPQDQERLVAFVEFIAKCQQIEKTLFFHCTALGRQLDMMLGAGRRHFPGAQLGAPPSVFAPGGRWGNGGGWAQKDHQQPITPAAASFVQSNQLASDVVISVYNATGTLLGVFQAAVAHSYPA